MPLTPQSQRRPHGADGRFLGKHQALSNLRSKLQAVPGTIAHNTTDPGASSQCALPGVAVPRRNGYWYESYITSSGTRKYDYIHRALYITHTGTPPQPGTRLHRRCTTRGCCNPEHYYTIPGIDEILDASVKPQ